MMTNIFVPKNGAVVDFAGLQAIQKMPMDCLEGYLATKWPTTESLILEGLEPNGKRPKKTGPPGVMQFSLQNFTLSAGKAIVKTKNDERFVLSFDEPQVIQLEEPSTSKRKRAIVVQPHQQQRRKNGKEFASQNITPLVNVVFIDQVSVGEVILAKELAPSIWATDVQRLYQPEHIVIQMIVKFFDHLEDVIWDSDRHGQVWNVQALGREWKTYQTKASVAVTAARMTLSARPSTTADRVRCLTNLHWQLQRSVEEAGKALEKWMGVVEAAGEYTNFFSAPPNWDLQ